MIQNDSTVLWVASHHTVAIDGETQDFYVNPRNIRVNMQLMTNEQEYQVYGKVTNSTAVLRTDSMPDFAKGDHLYLSAPFVIGETEISGQTIPDYGPGDYEVDSVKPAYLGGVHPRNPTVTTARIVTK